MRPNEQATNLTLTTAVESAKMGIHVASMAHIISLLTDLYSNKILAVLREYSTNAWDSHVDAGVTRPIEVTLPTQGNLVFKVQDFGIGLSKDELFEVYSQYGASTKRETNDATGMLGLGCKSALTYAPQFTVIANKDGMKAIVTVGKGADGVGEFQLLSHEETDDPNGVTVVLPVAQHDVRRFHQEAERFFFYWRDGNVLVDGEAPHTIEDDERWTKIDPDVYIKRQDYGESRLVQGGVAYPLEEDDSGTHSVVAYVPIGMVDFTPSREDLHLTDRTEEVVADTWEFVTRSVEQSFKDELEQCSHDWDRLRLYVKWRSVLPRARKGPSAILWNDFRRFENMPKVDNIRGWRVEVYTPTNNPYKHKASTGHPDWTLKRTALSRFPWEKTIGDNANSVFFVRGFDVKAFTDTHYERLREHDLIPEDVYEFYVLPKAYSERVNTTYFPGVHWQDVPEMRKVKERKARGPRQKTKYMVYQGGTTEHCQDLTDTLPDGALYRVCENRKRAVEGGDMRLVTILRSTDKPVALITMRQEEKFRRLFPDCKEAGAWWREQTDRLEKMVTDGHRQLLNKDPERVFFTQHWGFLRDRITNPHVLSLFDDSGDIPAVLRKALQTFNMLGRFMESQRQYSVYDRRSWNYSEGPVNVAFKLHYPLIADKWDNLPQVPGFIDHVVEYINANVPDGWDNPGQ